MYNEPWLHVYQLHRHIETDVTKKSHLNGRCSATWMATFTPSVRLRRTSTCPRELFNSCWLTLYIASYPEMTVVSNPVPNRADELEAAFATSLWKEGANCPRSVVRFM